MQHRKFAEIVTPELAGDAIINDEFPGFREDYLVLHSLIRVHLRDTFPLRSVRFLEIGTNVGTGTNIIYNALIRRGCRKCGKKKRYEPTVFTMDLPLQDAHVSLQHPGNRTGNRIKFDVKQIYANSLEFDYKTIYPLDGAWIDAEHTYDNVLHESRAMQEAGCHLIAWHDTDIDEVFNAVKDAINEDRYNIYRVEDTRITYAIKK